jgi:hypothetical protein
MAKKPSKKPRRPAASKKRSPGRAPKKKTSSRAPRPGPGSTIAATAHPMAFVAADAGLPAAPPKTFKGTVKNGVVVFDAGSPSPADGTRVEVNSLQDAPPDRTAVAFALKLQQKLLDTGQPSVIQLFDLIARDQNNQLSELQSQNIPNDKELIKSLLRRIADADANVGWTFQASGSVITG